ncbi:hypothetical protein N657DRAFT_677374 [Parathielavia appendiculata]|uniref:Uncharacterized protein n=1 Tax=Parathielavia appendiculata TaxID=2587402 RepID=A0AAN6UC30_9PEZI|nr:hypothetical protein N657DRAFT_677374 [Parathielavia appendiculata]
MFFADFAPNLVGKRPVFMSVSGGTRQTEYKLPIFDLEANLDYQYTMAMAKPNLSQSPTSRWATLSCKGVTVLTGSADRGPANQLTYCIDRDNPKNSRISEGHFASVFPASCLWVTSVGGTQFLPVANGSAGVSSCPGETAFDNNSTVSSGAGAGGGGG